MTLSLNPAAPHNLPVFITTPGETDVLMAVIAVFLVLAVLVVGLLFLRLHTLPERIAHKGHKLQFEIVAVLGLLALFTHMHIFWVIGLLLALIDIPDFGGTFNRMAGSLEKIARIPPGQGADNLSEEGVSPITQGEGAVEVPPTITPSRVPKERIHA
jgi:NADH:ubiquinone oxidoreductase subunit 5 (subunit L)/multisubunit Na+/H+ antiporter MnhA subunit